MSALSSPPNLRPGTRRRIDHLVAEAQYTGQVPLLVLAVVRDGTLAHVATAGAAGATADQARDTQFRIGSITKTMTAVLTLQERDAGRLDLDDPLGEHLPGTPVGRVTLRQLLGHAAGLQREPESGQWWERSSGESLDRLLAGLTVEKLAHRPHRRYHYSNLAYGLLGGVLERRTGQPWWDLVRTRLLLPLGMNRTSYLPVEPFARGFVVHPWHGTLREEPRTDTGAMAPAGQLWSTVADLARWAAFVADPAPKLLAADTLAEMCLPVTMSDPDSWTGGHGLGLELYRVGERVFAGHGGSMPGYVAALAVHRPTRTGVVAFANAYGFRTGSINELGLRVLNLVLDREPAPVTPWLPAPADPDPTIAELTGDWWWMGRHYEMTWDAATGELVMDRPGTDVPAAWRFVPADAGRWRGLTGGNAGEILTVHRDAAGRPVVLEIATFRFTRDPDQL
jgi:CubicO group peptidase (beta-lactamase class C family)